MSPLQHLGPGDVAALPWAAAVEAIAHAANADHRSAPARSAVPLARGELLLMPAESSQAVGVKVLTIAPDDPALRGPRVQGLYLLFDPQTLAPLALIDGPALTEVRTAAVSTHGISRLVPPDRAPGPLVVFGSGPQAIAHVRALRAVRPPAGVVLVARDADGLARAAAALADGSSPAVRLVPAADRRAVAEVIGGAEVVVCATTSRTPLFDGSLLPDDSVVVAVGSHEPAARELDTTVFRRAGVVMVEDVETALREAGDVIQALAEDALPAQELVPLGAIGALRASPGPRIFKSVGMAWEDLAIAAALVMPRR